MQHDSIDLNRSESFISVGLENDIAVSTSCNKEGWELHNLTDILRKKEVENDKLRRELQRLQHEKQIASEIFSETIAKYELDIAQLQTSDSHLELRLSQTTKKGSESVTCQSCGRKDSTVSAVPILHSGIPISSHPDRRPFMSAASSFVANLVGSSSSIRHPIISTHLAEIDKPFEDKARVEISNNSGINSYILSLPTSSNIEEFIPPCYSHAEANMEKFSETIPETHTESSGCLEDNPRSTTSSRNTSTAAIATSSTFWKSLRTMKLQTSSTSVLPIHDYETRQKQLMKIWIPIIQNWDRNKRSKHLHKQVHKGIPDALRAIVWRNAIGNGLNITRGLYDDLLLRVTVLRQFLLQNSNRYRIWLEKTLGPEALIDYRMGIQEMTKLQDIDNASLLSTTHVMANKTMSNEEINNINQLDINKNLSLQQRCTLCSSLWSPEIISYFETISCDLHRALPRLGVVPATAGQHTSPDSDDIINHLKVKRIYKNDLKIKLGQDHNIYSNKRLSSSQSEMIAPCNDIVTQSDYNQLIQRDEEHLIENNLLNETTRMHCNGISTECGVQPLSIGLAPRDGQFLYTRLRLLLETFVLLRPDIGYTQGMGYLAAMFILYMPDNFDAFVSFSNLMCRPSLYAFYTFNLKVISVYFKVFDELLQQKFPSVFTALLKAQIHSSQFLLDWMYTLFTRCLPLDLVSRIWDLFLIKGEIVLFQIGLALVHHIQLDEQNNLDGDRLSILFSSSSTNHFSKIDTEKFLEIASTFVIPHERISGHFKTNKKHQSSFHKTSDKADSDTAITPTTSFFNYINDHSHTEKHLNCQHFNDIQQVLKERRSSDHLPFGNTSHKNRIVTLPAVFLKSCWPNTSIEKNQLVTSMSSRNQTASAPVTSRQSHCVYPNSIDNKLGNCICDKNGSNVESYLINDQSIRQSTIWNRSDGDVTDALTTIKKITKTRRYSTDLSFINNLEIHLKSLSLPSTPTHNCSVVDRNHHLYFDQLSVSSNVSHLYNSQTHTPRKSVSEPPANKMLDYDPTILFSLNDGKKQFIFPETYRSRYKHDTVNSYKKDYNCYLEFKNSSDHINLTLNNQEYCSVPKYDKKSKSSSVFNKAKLKSGWMSDSSATHKMSRLGVMRLFHSKNKPHK